MNKKVSIIGANGFLSHSLQRFFISNNYIVKIIGRSKSIISPDSEFVPVDLFAEEFPVDSVINSDVIIYCAGAGIQSNKVESPNYISTLNFTVPVQIANKLDSYNYKGSFITFGSVFEIGNCPLNNKLSEIDILLADSETKNDYILTKRELSKFANNANFRYQYLHLILPNLYGPEELDHRLIHYVFTCIKNKTTPSFTSGLQVRQYFFVDDLGPIINKCIKRKIASGVYNVGNEEIISIRDLVSLIYKYKNEYVPDNCWGSTDRRDDQMMFQALDYSKLKSSIGIFSTTSLMEGLKLY